MKNLSGKQFVEMIESGANNLANNYQKIDALNVFPVPDGDTGTNMNLTFSSGYNDLKLQIATSVSVLAKTLSRGLLMGARGNSGVILSQIFRGFSQAITDKVEIDATDLALAFYEGNLVAYKAVMRPVEGTILTVLRVSSEKTLQYVSLKGEDCSIEEVLEVMVDNAKKALDNTPNLLPVLKEVGVVDSGGAGFLTILEGFLAYMHGNKIESNNVNNNQIGSVQSQFEHDEFGYCTEFIIQLNEKSLEYFDQDIFSKELEKLGNSLVVVVDEDIVKVHVHTLIPGDALNLGQRYGEFIKLKIENMSLQHDHLIDHSLDTLQSDNKVKVALKAPDKEFAIISVCSGSGLKDYFKSIRVDDFIDGGQTMNPSTDDIVNACRRQKAKHIFILPNNSNIILAAQQAASILDDLSVHVIESKTILQGIAAVLAFNPDSSLEINYQNMIDALHSIKSGQITYAIKDTLFNGVDIKANQFMAIVDKEIICACDNVIESLDKCLENMINDHHELVTVIIGEDGDLTCLNDLVKKYEDLYDIEFEIIDGKQPVYSYLIGVE